MLQFVPATVMVTNPVSFESIERFAAKWIPVRVKKTRQNKIKRFPAKWIPVRVKKTRQNK
jgi:hypothetical protein